MNIPRSHKLLTISNALSFLRLILAPIVVGALIYNRWLFAFFLFVGASLTDLLDGYLARRLQEHTVLGHYLDPIADKVLLISSFSALTYVHFTALSLPLWFFVMVIFREIIIIGGGVVILCAGVRVKLEPSLLGKITTASYMALIMWIFICRFAGWLPCKTFSVAIWAVAAIAGASLIHYCARAVLALRSMH